MWLFLAFLAVPLVEIALFIQVGGIIGLWPTLLIVVITAIVGTVLVRAQGAMALDDLRTSFSRQADPSEALVHGAMILIAGALLLTPGFFTDAVGFALLVPGFRRMAYAYVRARVHVARFDTAGTGPRDRGPDIIEGDYDEVDPPVRDGTNGSGWTRH